MSNVHQFPIKEWLGFAGPEELLDAAVEKSAYLAKTFRSEAYKATLELNTGQYEGCEKLGKYIIYLYRSDTHTFGLYGIIPHNLYIIPEELYGTEIHDRYLKFS